MTRSQNHITNAYILLSLLEEEIQLTTLDTQPGSINLFAGSLED